MSTLSVVVTRFTKQISELRNIIGTYGSTIADKMDKLFTPILPQEEIPNIAVLLKGMLKLMEHREARVEQLDQRVAKEEAEGTAVQKTRDTQLQTCREGTILLKKSLEGIYGAPVLKMVGLQGETPEDPVELYRLLHSATSLINEPNPILPPPIDPDGPTWTKEALIKRLSKLGTSMQEAVENVSREGREMQQAQIARRAAIQELRTMINSSMTLLESLARFTEETELADRIRPAGGRPTKTTADSKTPANSTHTSPTTSNDSTEDPYRADDNEE